MKRRMAYGAFTMVELLAVLAILAILISLVVPSITSILAGTNLDQGGKTVLDQVSLARQLASSGNATVEVRLIKTSASAQGYTAMQLWISGTGSSTSPSSKMVYLPQGVAISEDPGLSKMLSILPATSGTMSSGPSSGSSYQSFSIRPSGAFVPVVTGTNRANLYLTVVPARLATSGTLPANFAAIQVNPDTSSPLIFRP